MGQPAAYLFPTVEEFIGEGGTLDWPATVVENRIPKHDAEYRKDGMECIGAMRFPKIRLEPGEKKNILFVRELQKKRILTKNLKSTMAKKKQKKYGRKVKRSGREKLIKYSLEMVPTSLMVGSNG